MPGTMLSIVRTLSVILTIDLLGLCELMRLIHGSMAGHPFIFLLLLLQSWFESPDKCDLLMEIHEL